MSNFGPPRTHQAYVVKVHPSDLWWGVRCPHCPQHWIQMAHAGPHRREAVQASLWDTALRHEQSAGKGDW